MPKVNVVDLEFDGPPEWTGVAMFWSYDPKTKLVIPSYVAMARWKRRNRTIDIRFPTRSTESGMRFLRRIHKPGRKGVRVKNATIIQHKVKPTK